MSSHNLTVGDSTILIDFLSPTIVRVRKFQGGTPPEQWLNRYGFFRDEWPEVNTEV